MQEEENILRYLTHQMDEVERKQFEDKLDSDGELRESLDHSRRIMNMLDPEKLEFKEEVHSVITANRRSKSNRKFWLAASISIVTLFSILFFFQKISTPLDLAHKYQEPYPDVFTSRSVGETLDMSAYNTGNYIEAISVFESALKDGDDDLVRLYLGISYLMLDQNTKALEILDKEPLKKRQLKADFYWYKSLALIKVGRNREVKNILEELVEESSFYQKKSMDLLNSIK